MVDNIQKIISGLPEKDGPWKTTTSRKWKNDLYEFFKDKTDLKCLEIGSHIGITTFFLSHIFEEVHGIENSSLSHQRAKERCKYLKNCFLHLGDAYSDSTYDLIPKDIAVFVIDCNHEYEYVIQDINRCLGYSRPGHKIYLAFDDYGHPESTGIYRAVSQAIESGLTLERTIGQSEGFTVNRENGTFFSLIRDEGVILSFELPAE